MADYKHTQDGGVLHLPTGMNIPADPGNRHWQAFERWQQAGGVAEPADPETIHQPPTLPIISGSTDSEKLASLIEALKANGTITGG